MNEKQYHSLNKNQVLWNSIELFYCHPCLAFHEICYIEADKKYNTLKTNYQTMEYKIKVQVLKNTSWMKPCYLATFFVLKVSNNHICGLLIERFCFAWLFKERTDILHSWVNEKGKGLCKKWICCSNCILLKLNNVSSCI